MSKVIFQSDDSDLGETFSKRWLKTGYKSIEHLTYREYIKGPGAFLNLTSPGLVD